MMLLLENKGNLSENHLHSNQLFVIANKINILFIYFS